MGARPADALKYAPLIWSALWRKPAEALLTWLAVTAAFALFGVMLGVNATQQLAIDIWPANQLWVNPRFPGVRLPVGMREQIERIRDVTGVAVEYVLSGYHGDLRSPVGIITVDEGILRVRQGYALTRAQWERLFAEPDGLYVSSRAASEWHLREGDTFTVRTPASIRSDGAPGWPFRVLGVVQARSSGDSYLVGNFHYIDQSRPPADQGIAGWFDISVSDPARTLEISRAIDRLFANSPMPTRSIPNRMANQIMKDNSGRGSSLLTWTIGASGLFMILLLVANGIAQSVHERSAELAVMRTVGFTRTQLMALVFCEAVVPCVAGAILGQLLAIGLSRWPTQYLPHDFDSLPPPVISTSVILWAIGAGVLLACLSSAAPLLRVKRMSVVSELSDS